MVNRQQQKKGVQLVLDKKVFVHLAQEQYTALEELLPSTQFQTMGELFRHILDGKVVRVNYYDLSPDELLEEIGILGFELEVKADYIHWMSRCVYKQHSDPADLLVNAGAAAGVCEELGELIPVIYELVKKVSERWIQPQIEV